MTNLAYVSPGLQRKLEHAPDANPREYHTLVNLEGGGFALVYDARAEDGFAVQFFNADGSLRRDEIIIMDDAHGSERHAAALPDGGLVVSSEDHAYILGPNGGLRTDAVPYSEVEDPRGSGVSGPLALAVLSNGDFVILRHNNNAGLYDEEALLVMERFSSDGTPVGNQVHVSDAGGGVPGGSVEVNTLDGGRVLVTWESYGTDRYQDAEEGVYGRIFGADNSPATDEFLINTETYRSQDNHKTAVLSNGDFVVIWRSSDGGLSASGGSGFGVFGQRFASDGTRLGEEFLVNTTTNGHQSDAEVAPLSGGGFVVSWHSVGEVTFKLYDADGNPVSDEERAAEWDETVGQSQAELHALRDGGFLLSWQARFYDEELRDHVEELQAQRFLADGTPLGDVIVIQDKNSVINTGRSAYTDATLTDGDLVFSWYARNHVTEGESLFFRTLDIRTPFLGDEGDNVLPGTDGNDRLLGEGGDDTLDGGAGSDTLNGGDGSDAIIGGPAEDDLRDVIYGGDGHDSIDAGAGNDLVYGQGGNDTIAGGAGVDELQGQDGDDVITGSNFSDLVFGGAGNDFVNGGFGHDRINGGSGADKFFHVGVEGHGSDWVQDYIAADGDVLLWGGGPATADDFQVNFAHTANDAGERAGDDAVREAFVIYKPTGQIIWALVDGEGQSAINLQIGGDTFDLLG